MSWKGKCSVLITCTWNQQENDPELACKHHECGPVIPCFKMQIVVVFIGSKSKYKCSWINNVSSAEWFYPLGRFLWFGALVWAELFMNCRSSLFWRQSVTSLLTHCAVNSWKRTRFYFSLNKHYCHSFFPAFFFIWSFISLAGMGVGRWGCGQLMQIVHGLLFPKLCLYPRLKKQGLRKRNLILHGNQKEL